MVDLGQRIVVFLGMEIWHAVFCQKFCSCLDKGVALRPLCEVTFWCERSQGIHEVSNYCVSFNGQCSIHVSAGLLCTNFDVGLFGICSLESLIVERERQAHYCCALQLSDLEALAKWVLEIYLSSLSPVAS